MKSKTGTTLSKCHCSSMALLACVISGSPLLISLVFWLPGPQKTCLPGNQSHFITKQDECVRITLNEGILILETSHLPLNHDYGRKGNSTDCFLPDPWLNKEKVYELRTKNIFFIFSFFKKITDATKSIIGMYIEHFICKDMCMYANIFCNTIFK